MNAPAARGHLNLATWVSLASQFDALDSMNVSAHTRSRCPADFARGLTAPSISGHCKPASSSRWSQPWPCTSCCSGTTSADCWMALCAV